MSLLELFCAVDTFCVTFLPHWHRLQLATGKRRRQRSSSLCPSEIMTILIFFHQARYRDFKTYYTCYVQRHLHAEFPGLVSYQRFVELIPTVLVPLCAFLQTTYGSSTGIAFIDSTPLAVCNNRRIQQHKVFRGLAARGKTSMGWFYGFKLHLVINDRGEVLNCRVTPGNVDDRRPVRALTGGLFGRLFGDKGYISQALFEELQRRGLRLITTRKRRMRNVLMQWSDKVLLRKRVLIETVVDQLKNISQIEHTRHRSPFNFAVHLVCGLIAYSLQPRKPSLQLNALAHLETVIPN